MISNVRSPRRFQRLIAIALALLMLQGAVDAFHLIRDDGGMLGPRAALTGTLAPQVGVPTHDHDASNPHCAICHWLQLLGASQISHYSQTPQPPTSLYHSRAARVRLRQVACSRVPARGPPSPLLTRSRLS